MAFTSSACDSRRFAQSRTSACVILASIVNELPDSCRFVWLWQSAHRAKVVDRRSQARDARRMTNQREELKCQAPISGKGACENYLGHAEGEHLGPGERCSYVSFSDETR